ncbi:hypothetical protein [Herbaspirillum huttiense]|uniref:hypothetical protein n=1 Tax=Herbaspirillum huttiense TaxID=863372 RepID=UPI00058512D1|nr:hypothetical protein [Herbaspirillum huttiense]
MTQSQQTHDAIVSAMKIGSVILVLLVLAFYFWLRISEQKPAKKKNSEKGNASKAKQKRLRSRRMGR